MAPAGAAGRLVALVAELSVEAGEAVGALVRGLGAGSATPGRLDAAERARAVKECRELHEVLAQVLAIIDGGS